MTQYEEIQAWCAEHDLPAQPPAVLPPSTGAVTVADLDALVKNLFEQRAYIEAVGEYVMTLNKRLIASKGTAVRYLRELGREDFKSTAGTITINQKWRVNLPETDEDKAVMFQHLKDRGIFDRYATVNSASLNSLYLADWEAAKNRGEGMEFSFPGIGAATMFEDLGITKPKAKKEKSDE